MGAVIIQAVVTGMMDVGEMRRVYKIKRSEFRIALLALLGVVTFGILWGVVIGVLLSLIWLVSVSSEPLIPELGRKPNTRAFLDLIQHPESETYPGLSIVRFDGGLIFVNADALGDRMRQLRLSSAPPVQGIILTMEGVNFIDVEVADMLDAIAEGGKIHDIDFRLVRVKPQVQEVLEKEGVLERIGPDHIHANIDEAVEAYLKDRKTES